MTPGTHVADLRAICRAYEAEQRAHHEYLLAARIGTSPHRDAAFKAWQCAMSDRIRLAWALEDRLGAIDRATLVATDGGNRSGTAPGAMEADPAHLFTGGTP